MKNIVLASQSPRRRELLSLAGYKFDVIPSTCEETVSKTDPREVVEELSRMKAMDVYNSVIDNRKYGKDEVFVIGADTIVSIDGDILGKPSSREDSYNMIKRLQGTNHHVYTGVTFVWFEGELKIHTFSEQTKVYFYPMNDDEIKNYVATGDGDDKAGSYGIQSKCAKYIEKIEGDYNNVVGLPIARIYQEIKKSRID